MHAATQDYLDAVSPTVLIGASPNPLFISSAARQGHASGAGERMDAMWGGVGAGGKESLRALLWMGHGWVWLHGCNDELFGTAEFLLPTT